MRRFLMLIVLVLLAVPGLATDPAETPGPGFEPGIYVDGKTHRLLCPLTDINAKDRPVHDESRARVLVAPDETRFEVQLSEQARSVGLRPGGLRLLRLNQPNSARLGKIVSLSYEWDRLDKNRFAATVPKDLEAGSYRFAVEVPDYSTGKADLVMKMIFFDCGFTVEETP